MVHPQLLLTVINLIACLLEKLLSVELLMLKLLDHSEFRLKSVRHSVAVFLVPFSVRLHHGDAALHLA